MAYREDSYYISQVLEKGDASAFAGLINKHKTMAYNIAYRITRNREDAEEVAQDAFVKVYHNLQQFRGESKFTTWLYKVIYNLGLSKIRKKSLSFASIDDENFYEEGQSDDAFLDADKLTVRDRKLFVNKALDNLDESESLLITLYYMNDLPVEEISDITGLSESNVKVKLFRARKKMQQHLNSLLKDEIHSIL
jgi:RNA polymerase sigma factor (sigma-70 family)